MVVCFLGLCMFDASRRTFPTPDPILDAQLTVFVTNQQPARCAQPRSNWLPIKARQPPAVRRVYAATSPASKSRPQQQTIPVILSTPVVFQFPWTLTKRPFLGPIGCRSIFFIFCSRTILIAHFCVLSPWCLLISRLFVPSQSTLPHLPRRRSSIRLDLNKLVHFYKVSPKTKRH